LPNGVGDEGEEWGAHTKGVFANNRIDLCTKGVVLRAARCPTVDCPMRVYTRRRALSQAACYEYWGWNGGVCALCLL